MISHLLWHGIAATALRGADGSSAVVAEHGAHLLSWIPAGGAEALFVSERTSYADGAAIRGGVPVIFPQFGERGPGKRHGFARNLRWRLLSATVADGCPVVRHGLDSDTAGSAQWPHRFSLVLEVRLQDGQLQLALEVGNPSQQAWEFSAALHTYLRVDAQTASRVHGLQGVRFIDQVRQGAEQVQVDAALAIEQEVDRIYCDAPSALRLDDGQRSITVGQSGFADTVIWNPGAEKGNALADLQVDDFRAFVCIEAAAAARPVRLAAGAHWRGTQTLHYGAGPS